MEREVQRHQHLGVYGVCVREGRLLTVVKQSGPYVNRFVLPGGRMKKDETLVATLLRKYKDETGATPCDIRHLGATDVLLYWAEEGYDPIWIHHIALLYQVDIQEEADEDAPWMRPEELNGDNASPVLLRAAEWVMAGRLPLDTPRIEEWKVRERR